jgi:hypothetical protein
MVRRHHAMASVTRDLRVRLRRVEKVLKIAVRVILRRDVSREIAPLRLQADRARAKADAWARRHVVRLQAIFHRADRRGSMVRQDLMATRTVLPKIDLTVRQMDLHAMDEAHR